MHWLITMFDPTSQSRSTSLNIGPVPASAAPAVVDSIARLAARSLWQLDHTPRRGGASPAPAAAPAPPPVPDSAAPPAAPIKRP